MIRGGPYFLGTNKLTQFFYRSGLNVGTLIAMKPLGNAIVKEEVVPQALSHCSGLLVRGWDGHCIFCKVLGNNQNVFGVT